MIKANELRIGNWYNQFGNYEQVSVETLKTLSQSGENQLFCKPIPLTEEILLKCGFRCIDKLNKHYSINDPNGYKDSHTISIIPTLNDKLYIAFSDILNGYKDYIPTTKIKYLHQLQNLYWCLCGEELEINL